MARQSHIQFTIPEPCTVPWDGMTPVDPDRRHCSSCDKVITNFSGMSDDELMLYFKHSHGKICGVFANDQLNRRIKLLPEKTQRAGWWRMLLLIPLSFFSKSSRAQSNDSIDSVLQSDSVSLVNDSTQNIPAIANTDPDSISQIDSTELATENRNDSDIALRTVPPEGGFTETLISISGDVSITTTVGFCSMPLVPGEPDLRTALFWDRLFPTWRKLKKNEQQIDKPNPLKEIADQPEKKPEPKAPALPASNEISGIMPEERKKFRRS